MALSSQKKDAIHGEREFWEVDEHILAHFVLSQSLRNWIFVEAHLSLIASRLIDDVEIVAQEFE